jgi:hypothetical protein
MAIEVCGDDSCSLTPCIPLFLLNNVTDSFQHFTPGYGGNFGYEAFTASLIGDLVTSPWNGCSADRTNTDPAASILISTIAQTAINQFADSFCDATPDDFDVCIIGVTFDFPNPVKIGCTIALAILKGIGLTLKTLSDQMSYQDGLVNAAEIEAAYEHSVNLLSKECAIFDQAVCRCVPEDRLGFGHGCDGKDSNCDDFPDDCGEDVIVPTIYIEGGLCDEVWFATDADAEKCVSDSTIVSDDCQPTTFTVNKLAGQCQETEIVVLAEEKTCGKSSSKLVTVKVDGTKPEVSCSFSGKTTHTIVTTGPGILTDIKFTYTAFDNCGLPLDVSIDMYANEIENFNAQEMALFFNPNRADVENPGLYVAATICSTTSNGQCIKDPKAPKTRIFTAVISATDQAGNEASAECKVQVIPKGKFTPAQAAAELTASTQNFFLTSYDFVYVDGPGAKTAQYPTTDAEPSDPAPIACGKWATPCTVGEDCCSKRCRRALSGGRVCTLF